MVCSIFIQPPSFLYYPFNLAAFSAALCDLTCYFQFILHWENKLGSVKQLLMLASITTSHKNTYGKENIRILSQNSTGDRCRVCTLWNGY